MSFYLGSTTTATGINMYTWTIPRQTTRAPTPWPVLCFVCRQAGPGMTETPDGLRVHRWPCLERLR